MNRILIAEDDEDDQYFITLAFNQLSTKHDIQIVNNGKEALRHLAHLKDEELPCLIVLDLNMPVLDGFDTLEALSTEIRYDAIPKVIFTTSNSDEYKDKSLSNGAVDYIVKPTDINFFIPAVQKILAYCR